MSCKDCEKRKTASKDVGLLFGMLVDLFVIIAFMFIGIMSIGAGIFVWAYFTKEGLEVVGRVVGVCTIMAGVYALIGGVNSGAKSASEKSRRLSK